MTRDKSPVQRFAWPMTIIALILASGLPHAAEASEPMPPPRQVWTVYTTVEATVDDNFAVVRVIADIANRGPDPEFPFAVRVPEGAFVSGLTIIRDGVVAEAEVKERDEARKAYDAHKANEETGGLVEKRRGTEIYAYLINVAEFTNVRAILTYESYLAADAGVFNLPLEAPVSGFGEDQGARFDVLVRHSDGVVSAWGTPEAHVSEEDEGWRIRHAVGPRPTDDSTSVVTSYIPRPTGSAGSLAISVQDGAGYFAHRFRAPPDALRIPLDLVLVLDTSGSMSGLKIQQLQDAATQVVGLLGPDDRLQLVFFSSDATTPWRGLREADPDLRQRAVNEIRATFAAGGTNIEAGMRQGLGALDGLGTNGTNARMPIVVILTDGQPTAGVTDRTELRRIARDGHDAGASVFALAFGSEADWGLVHGLAADGGGVAIRVPEGQGAEVDLRHFIAALTTPVLKDVRVVYGDDIESRFTGAPILFAGSELLVLGTFDASLATIEGMVYAVGPDGERTYPFAEEIDGADGASFLPRLVAYHRILELEATMDAEGPRAEWADEATRLALEHGFVTDYTSLVLLLDHRDPPVRRVRWDARTQADSFENDVLRDQRTSQGSPVDAGRLAELETQREPAGTPGFGGFLGIAALGAVAGASLLAARDRRRNL